MNPNVGFIDPSSQLLPVVRSSVPRFASRNRTRYAVWNPIPCSNQPHPPTSAQSQNPCGGLQALLEHPLCCSKLPETLHGRFHKEKCQHVKGSSECQSDQGKSASMQLQVVAKGLGYLHHQAESHSAAISKLCCRCSQLQINSDGPLHSRDQRPEFSSSNGL